MGYYLCYWLMMVGLSCSTAYLVGRSWRVTSPPLGILSTTERAVVISFNLGVLFSNFDLNGARLDLVSNGKDIDASAVGDAFVEGWRRSNRVTPVPVGEEVAKTDEKVAWIGARNIDVPVEEEVSVQLTARTNSSVFTIHGNAEAPWFPQRCNAQSPFVTKYFLFSIPTLPVDVRSWRDVISVSYHESIPHS